MRLWSVGCWLVVVADVVAKVEITRGDAEHYRQALYQSTVIENFKGTKAGESLYFGPFNGYRLAKGRASWHTGQ